jgi:endonuclease VIII
MPEGDSIFVAAKKLHAALAGQVITRFASPRPELQERGVEGHRVTLARAHGKHVIIELDDGRALLSHLRMQGSWYVTQKASLSERLRKRLSEAPRWDDEDLSLIIETETSLAKLERAAIVELAPLCTVERRLSGLGPDLLAPDYDPAAALASLREHPQLSIGEAVMLQSIVAGIGNIYKSETLFLEKVSPFAALGELDDATLQRVLKRARELMRRNTVPGPRRTTFGSFAGSKYWVYERSGQHCLKCDAKIAMRRQGAMQRSTYFCPECQGIVADAK